MMCVCEWVTVYGCVWGGWLCMAVWHMCASTYTSVCLCVCLWGDVWVQVYLSVCVFVSLCVFMYVSVCLCMCVYVPVFLYCQVLAPDHGLSLWSFPGGIFIFQGIKWLKFVHKLEGFSSSL